MNTASKDLSNRRMNTMFLGVTIFWSVLIAALACLNYWQLYYKMIDVARFSAYDSYSKDIIYRHWAAGHGGVYVPITPETPPNPYLADIPERDISTPSGRKLTLMNPAYMTRQAHELGKKAYGVQGHITSLKPVRPENAPDEWERKALQAFEKGQKEVVSLEKLGGETHLRLMRPLSAEAGCLNCHAKDGYKLGDVRGGLSVSIPWATSHEALWTQLLSIIFGYGVIWAIGILGLYLARKRLQNHLSFRKLSEAKVSGLNLELHDRLQELLEAQGMAQEAGRAKAEFLANMSHELNTPLNSIIGFSQVLLEKNAGNINEKQRGYLENIHNSGEKLHKSLENIISFVSMDVSNPRMDWEDVRLKDVVDSVLSIFRKAAADHQLTITLDMEKEADRIIRADRVKLISVFQCLLSNAVKFNREGGSVRVSARTVNSEKLFIDDYSLFTGNADGDFIEISVEDTGIGIKEEDVPRLFRPFEQMEDHLTRQFAGMGMGLTLAKKLIEAHGGTIRVESVYGQGSRFIITIPVKKSEQ